MNRELFELKLLRLKTLFGLREDQEVAALLGISRNSLYIYKTRGRFPTDKLRELAERSPEMADKVALVLDAPVPTSQDSNAETRYSTEDLLALIDRVDKAVQARAGDAVEGRRAEIAHLLQHLNADSLFHVWWFVQRLARADGMDAAFIKASVAHAAEADNADRAAPGGAVAESGNRPRRARSPAGKGSE